MSKNYPQMATDLTGAIGTMRNGIPRTMEAFSVMAKVATAPGALNRKTKEVLATAIAVAVRCDGCIAFHVPAVIRARASREELLETIALAIYRGGGRPIPVRGPAPPALPCRWPPSPDR